MKLLSLLAAATLVASTSAVDCTQNDLSAVRTSAAYQAFQALDCSKPIRVGTPCSEIPCLAGLEAVVAILPDCTSKGVSLKAEYEARVTKHRSQCTADGSAPTANSTASATATATTATTAPPAVVATTTRPPAVVATTTRPPTSDGVPECTLAQLQAISADTSSDAREAACGSPVGTDSTAASKKICEKPCLDAWAVSVASKPKCAMMGDKYYELFESDFELVKSGCAKFFSNATSNETAAASASPTAAPAASPAMAVRLSAMATATVAAVAVWTQL